MLVGNKTKNRVNFISYTGSYPCLCHGELTLEIDGTKHTFGYGCEFPHFWSSGGYISDDYEVVEGEWEIDVERLPEQFWDVADEIDKVFNENVPYGCCGGCI
jgi:hypothetical protein